MYKYFSQNELKCKCGKCSSTGYEMLPVFMRKLEALRGYLGFAFPLTSAYRCPAHNSSVSTTGQNGPHTTGRAVDIGIKNKKDAYKILYWAHKFGFTGIGVNLDKGTLFIHLDDLELPEYPRPAIWLY